MSTFDNPLDDAAQASEALRGLAHATRTFQNPADTYAVIGDLLSGVRSLRQVLDQLATTHLTHQHRAFDDAGSHQVGAEDALAAADELHHAGSLLDAAIERLDAACQTSGRIAWHPTGSGVKSVRRYVSVVFLQGEEADHVLDLLDANGTDAAIDHLSNWDYGAETEQAALVNGYLYDTPPVGALDRTAEREEYVLTYNHDLGHVSLLRSFTPEPEPETVVGPSSGVGREAPAPDRAGAFADPFRPRNVADVVPSRGLGL